MKVKRTERPPVTPRPAEMAHPLIVFGPPPFGPSQEQPDDVRIGGFRLRRGPDGRLIGIAEPQEACQ